MYQPCAFRFSGPGNTSVHNGTEYAYFNKTNVTFDEAVNLCQLWGGDLALIKDNATQRHLVESMPKRDCRTDYFIGLTHLKINASCSENSTLNFTENPVWTWKDGTLLNETGFSNWQTTPNGTFSKQEPNGCRLQEDGKTLNKYSPYVQISGNPSAYLGKWFDRHQGSSWFVICEKNYTPSTTMPAGEFLQSDGECQPALS